MKVNQWLKVAIIIIALVIGWILLVYAADWPLVQESHDACPICRAGKEVTSYMLIPMYQRISENEFSRYYRSNADPQHQHVWVGCGMSRRTRTGDISAHGGFGSLRLQYEVALAILKSLPDGKARKEFFEHLYVPDESLPKAHKVSDAIWKLNDAYWEDEHRKDWLDQLRKVNLYPDVASDKH